MLRTIWSWLVRLAAGIEVAVDGVRTGGLRSVLTVLGVSIGVASVVSLLAVGQGARLAVAAQYQALGTNVISIQSHSGLVRLTRATAATLTGGVPFASAVMPVVGLNAPVRWRLVGANTSSSPTVLGVTPALLKIRKAKVAAGTFLNATEERHALDVAVLGHTAAVTLFGGLDPIGQQIYIGQVPFRVIGVLAAQPGGVPMGSLPALSGGGSSSAASGSGGGSGTGGATASSGGSGSGSGSSSGSGSGKGPSPQQTVALGTGIGASVLIPERTAEWLTDNTEVSAIWMKAKSRAEVQPAVLQAQRILSYTFHLGPSGGGAPGGFKGVGPFAGGFPGPGAFGMCPGCGGGGGGQLVLPGGGGPAVSVQSLDALVKQADAANRVLTLMLTAIAGVSLLVGGIGVMNIMLVSVRERTVEIGLRKALGALQGDLLYQFVLEALLLCGVGGALGWLAGFGGVQLLQHYGVKAAPLPGALGVALLAAAGIGVLFGTYPAYLASELEPVEALRRA